MSVRDDWWPESKNTFYKVDRQNMLFTAYSLDDINKKSKRIEWLVGVAIFKSPNCLSHNLPRARSHHLNLFVWQSRSQYKYYWMCTKSGHWTQSNLFPSHLECIMTREKKIQPLHSSIQSNLRECFNLIHNEEDHCIFQIIARSDCLSIADCTTSCVRAVLLLYK